jgi:predicted TIM-barrel fold metal-dependent hydrolase
MQAMARYFKTDVTPVATVPALAAYYRERKLACVTFIVDSSAATGRTPALTNEEVARLAHENSDVVIPFASVDPHAGRAAANHARRLIEEHGVKGFKFHPNTQEFYPNDRFVYPLYEVLAERGVPALFHSGHTGAGAGVRGGGGVRLKYSNPMHVDDVAVDFPDLPIVLAHPSFPWQDEAISVALHKPSVYIDLSGWSPKYFPANLVQYANTLLREKVMFGSDFPVIKPERWLADFEKLEIKPEVRPLILKENAARLLGLTPAHTD